MAFDQLWCGLMRVLRFVLFMGQPKISLDEARRLAQEECERRGWYWEEPVKENDELLMWHFYTASNVRGGNVVIRVSMRDGRIVQASFVDH